MKKTINFSLAFVVVILLLSAGLAAAAEEDLTIAAVLPLTGQFGPAGQLGAAG
jgi:ABC-type sugar transport system substrate-binding protein